jgi:hypothetical protein
MSQQTNKQKYCKPEVVCIELDNQISLTLNSFGGDPYEPGMLSESTPELKAMDPFKTGA